MFVTSHQNGLYLIIGVRRRSELDDLFPIEIFVVSKVMYETILYKFLAIKYV